MKLWLGAAAQSLAPRGGCGGFGWALWLRMESAWTVCCFAAHWRHVVSVALGWATWLRGTACKDLGCRGASWVGHRALLPWTGFLSGNPEDLLMQPRLTDSPFQSPTGAHVLLPKFLTGPPPPYLASQHTNYMRCSLSFVIAP